MSEGEPDSSRLLKDLERRVTELEKQGRREEALRFYREQIFPAVRERFVEQARDVLCGKKYQYLVLTTGKTSEPLVLSVSAFRPRKAYFLYTEGSERTIDDVAEACDLKIRDVERKRVRPSESRDVYKAVKDIVEEVGGVGKLAIDITGGTKVMVGGCSMAAALLRADIFYVESESGWCMGKSRPGSERLVKLENPYEVFGDLDMEIGVELFNEHAYTGARGIFNRLAKDGINEPRSRTFCLLSEAYECWDRFNYREARPKMEDVLRRLRNTPLLPEEKVHTLEAQVSILDTLKRNQKENLSKLLRDEMFTASLVCDLYANALRREEQGRYDDGIIRLYRILELISQSRLARGHGIDAGSVKGVPLEAAERFAELSAELYKGRREVPKKLALMDGWTLLLALKDSELGIGSLEELKALKDITQRRNLSMVEHSNESRDRKDFQDFEAFTLPFIRKAVPDLEERLTWHRFIEL